MSDVLDRIAVPGQKNAVSFMQSVSKGEEQNSAYAHAPFLRIVDRMRDNLGDDDLQCVADAVNEVGLAASTRDAFSDDVPPSGLVGTDPEAGVRVPRGETVAVEGQ